MEAFHTLGRRARRQDGDMVGADPAKDGGGFQVNDGFGRRRTKVAVVEGLKYACPVRSSASLVTQPSWIGSPRTWHIISSRAVSEPGIPIAGLV